MKKIIKRFFIILFVSSISIFGGFFAFSDDLLTQWFQDAIREQAIINIWSNKKDVWHAVLRPTTTMWTSIYKEAPLIVRIVKVILKITIVLSVSMVIFSSIKFMIQIANGSEIKSAGAVKDLKNILIWLLIALFSITAINLVISLPKNSLKTQNTYLDNWWQVFYI